MKQQIFLRTLLVLGVGILIFRPIAPAQAFWLGVPSHIQSLWQQVKAEEGGQVSPPPAGGGQQMPPPSGGVPGQAPGGQMPLPPGNMPGGQSLGVPSMPPPPGGMPGKLPGGKMGPLPNGMMGEQRGQLEGIRRGGFEMERNLGKFERMMQEEQQNGKPPSAEMQSRMNRAHGTVEQVKGATSLDDFKNTEMNQLGDDMQAMEQERRERQMQEQQLKMLQRGIKGIEQGVTGFERQLTRLTKQGLTLPGDVSEKLSKAKEIIGAVKNAKTFEEAQNAGMEDLQDIMQDLNDSRQQLEMLARWPQTLKQIDRQLAQLQRELKQSKAIVERLKKKEIDLSSTYNAFAEAVAKLKGVRDEADIKAKAGDMEAAMELLQEDFFGQLDDIRQNEQVIITMSNLGRFMSDFKRSLSEAERQVRQAERKKLDTTELRDLLSQAQAKGAEIKAMLQGGGEIDEEEIMSTLHELEDIKQQFQEKAQDLLGTGQDQLQQFQGGGQQFQELRVSPDVRQLLGNRRTDQRGNTEESGPAALPDRQ